MKNNYIKNFIYYCSLFIATVCIAGCSIPETLSDPDVATTEEAIQQRVVEMLTAWPTSIPDLEVTKISQTATAYVATEHNRIETKVAATLTAQPTNSPIATATPIPALSTAKTAQEALQIIRALGLFRAGVRYDAGPFGYDPDYKPGQTDSFKPEGFDIDIVREFARLWLNNPDSVKLVPVNSKTRFSALSDNKVDLTAGAIGKTEERCGDFECSNTYVVDQPRLLVHADSPITGLCDPSLRLITVLTKTTAIGYVPTELNSCDNIERPKIELFDSRSDAIDVVVEDKSAAYTTDSVILKGWQEIYAKKGESLKIVGNRLKAQDYFALLVQQNNSGLLALINVTLQKMYMTERYHGFYEKWFGCDNTPFPISTDNPELPGLLTDENYKHTSICEKCPDPYIVQLNDTLWDLAAHCLGDATLYICIHEFNADRQGITPSELQAGAKLNIPPKSECLPFDFIDSKFR